MQYSKPLLFRPNPSIPRIQPRLRSYLLGIGPRYPNSRYLSTAESISTFLPIVIRGTHKFDHQRSLLSLQRTQKDKTICHVSVFLCNFLYTSDRSEVTKPRIPLYLGLEVLATALPRYQGLICAILFFRYVSIRKCIHHKCSFPCPRYPNMISPS